MRKESTSIVIYVLVGAALRYGWNTDRPDLQSVYHKEAATRLMELALAEDKEETEIQLEQLQSFGRNITGILSK